ncbi:MAG TPA: hypothetical protein VFB68_00270 [Xanthobacteraceae bacterium]|nr:hypothetical protein [Xanthobacteraceae bacterium]
MAALAGLFLLLGIVTVIYPIRAIGLDRRFYGVVMIFVGVALAVAADTDKPQTQGRGTQQTQSRQATPNYGSSSRCYTDSSGTYRCEGQSNFGALGSATSNMVCRKNPITDQQDCTFETNVR